MPGAPELGAKDMPDLSRGAGCTAECTAGCGCFRKVLELPGAHELGATDMPELSRGAGCTAECTAGCGLRQVMLLTEVLRAAIYRADDEHRRQQDKI